MPMRQAMDKDADGPEADALGGGQGGKDALSMTARHKGQLKGKAQSRLVGQ